MIRKDELCCSSWSERIVAMSTSKGEKGKLEFRESMVLGWVWSNCDLDYKTNLRH